MPFVETTSLKKRNREIPAIAAILLLAVILRTYRLEDALHIFMDEMHFVDAVTLLRDFDNVELLHPVDGLAQFPRVFPYLQLIGVDIFGPTLVGIRVVSVAMGVLGVAALYLLAKTLFDRKTALLASFLLATFPPHLHYSRLAMNNIGDPLFGTLMLAFLTRGLKTGRRVDFTLAGASLGLTQYFYEGGRLLYPGLLIAWLAGWWLIELLQRRRIPFNVSLLRSLALMAVTALIIALPYYYTLFGMNFALMPRMEGMGMGSDYLKGLLSLDGALLQDFLLYRVKLPLLHYVFRPDGGHFFYGGETALILPYLVPAFLLGIFTALWRLPKPGILLLLWLLLTALGNALIITPDWTARFVVVFPALALTTAVGMRYVLALVWPTDLLVRTRCGTFLQKKVFLLGGIFILLAAGYAQVNYYFGPHLAINNREVRLTPKDVHDAMFRTRALPPGTQVYLITPLEEVYYPQVSGMIAFWKLDIRVGVWAPDEDLPSRIESLSNEIDRAFFVYPADTDTIALLRQKFPRLRGPEFSPYNTPGDKQYALYYAPRDR